MTTMPPQTPGRSAGTEDHCLVHQFIRTHGRRPTDAELEDMGASTAGSTPGRHLAAPSGLAWLLRREVARLVHRL
ncbi:hypothetical protein F4692_002755 [Nocardioides cavernae]|uniref:Uncharacterized protein n=1 Tax=Nocardioides cavernae TaxID=1921566 RepID=A0A7Y9H448_9ACTN|nr:hypothetical protein [Nocardioides cavernae]NYE37622.1 hypothetical protein [Nocardioides cavernae]